MSNNDTQDGRTDFHKELEGLINKHSIENGSNTPDFILANYLQACLANFEVMVRARDTFFGYAPREDLASEIG